MFKEINRVHKATYGWKMMYWNVWYSDRIDIESDVRFDTSHEKWIPLATSDEDRYYFNDNKGRDITLHKGLFAWEAYNFTHLNPYKYNQYRKFTEEDFVSDSLGKRIGPDVGHTIKCLETIIKVLQTKQDGKIWISSGWLSNYGWYGSGEGAGVHVYEALGEAACEDEKVYERLKEKYEDATRANGQWFEKALESYFRGGKLNAKYWDGGYLFAASKEWRIKTLEQFNEAKEVEENHFLVTLEEFIEWLGDSGIKLGREAEENLRRRMKEFYIAYPQDIAEKWCKLLVEEDKVEPSDVYLWWGGEPGSDSCYAFLTLFFEVDPDDIGTSQFGIKVSRNLKAIINIAENDNTWLSSYRLYEPIVFRAIFS